MWVMERWIAVEGLLSLSDDQLMLFTAQRGLFPRITECTIAGDIDSGFDFDLHQSIGFVKFRLVVMLSIS